MADLNLIRTRLLLIIRPELSGEEGADFIGLFEEWGAWTQEAEVDLVADTLEEGKEPRFLRLLIQYLSLIGTTRALARLHRLAQHAPPAIIAEAMRSLEKSGTLAAQRLLLDWALQNDDYRVDVLQALTRSATSVLVEDLKLALLRPLHPENELGILAIFKKLQARDSVDALFDILEEPRGPKIHTQAIFSIAHLGRPDHLRKILPFLKTEEAGMRRAAFFALARLDLKSGPQRVLEHLAGESDAAVRMEALRNLQSVRDATAEAIRLAEAWSLQADHPYERRLAEGLVQRWQTRLTTPKALGRQALTDVDPAKRSAALEALAFSLPALSDAFPDLESLKKLRRDPSAMVRYSTALLLARFTPTDQLVDFLPEEAEGPALRAFLYTLDHLGRAERLPAVMLEKLVLLARTGDRSLRTLALALLAGHRSPTAARQCQVLALEEKEPRLAREAAWGALLYASLFPFAFEDLLGPLVKNRRSALHLISLIPRLEARHPKARKGLALRLGIFLSTRPYLQDTKLSRSTAGWLLFWRALGKDLEGDYHEWFSLGSLPREGSAWLLRVLVSLLRGKTLRMDFRWLSTLMDSPHRPTREQAAGLSARHFPWTPDQTRKLVRWRITESDERIQNRLAYMIREESLGFTEDRRLSAR